MSSIVIRITRAFACVVFVLLNMGCEAPLNLAGIEREEALITHRFDQFQASARNQRAVIVVGSSGVILSSADNGESWHRNELQGKPTLVDVSACTNGTFVALSAERQLWLSEDDGANWQSHSIETEESLTTLTCAPDNTFWLGGSFSTLLSSQDPAKGWETFSLGEDAMITAIQFIDNQHAFALGEFGLVLRSSNNGKDWQLIDPLPNELYPQDALFQSVEVGFVVGLNGKILSTQDSGQSWVLEKTDTENPLFGLGMLDGELYAVGESGILLHRTKKKWVTIPHHNPARSYLRSIQSLDEHQLLLAGGGGVMFRFSPEHSSSLLVTK